MEILGQQPIINALTIQHCVCQVFLDATTNQSLVYQKDFFHRLFDKLVSTNPKMFQFNDAETVAWFPTTVRLFFLFICLYAVFFKYSNSTITWEFCASHSTCIDPGNSGGQESVPPVWRSVRIGFVQPELYTVTFPSGSVQEASQRKTDS